MKSSDEGPFLTLGLSQPEAKQSEPRLGVPLPSAGWTLESELARPIPRRVVLRWGGMAKLLVFPVIYLAGSAVVLWGWSELSFFWKFLLAVGGIALGVLILYGVESSRRFDKLLVSTGTPTRGILVEATSRMVTAPRGKGEYRVYDHVIAYHTPARYFLRLQGERSERTVRDTLTLLYLPESPERVLLYEDCWYKAVASEEVST